MLELHNKEKVFDWHESERLMCVVSPDNEVVFTGTPQSCSVFILKHQSQSVHWATTHGGWKIVEQEKMSDEETYQILEADPFSKVVGLYEKETSSKLFFKMKGVLWEADKNFCSWRPYLEKGNLIFASNGNSKKCE